MLAISTRILVILKLLSKDLSSALNAIVAKVVPAKAVNNMKYQ